MLIACELSPLCNSRVIIGNNSRYYIKEGRVSESGSHEELLARRGDYYNSVHLQGLTGRGEIRAFP